MSVPRRRFCSAETREAREVAAMRRGCVMPIRPGWERPLSSMYWGTSVIRW